MCDVGKQTGRLGPVAAVMGHVRLPVVRWEFAYHFARAQVMALQVVGAHDVAAQQGLVADRVDEPRHTARIVIDPAQGPAAESGL